MPHENHFHTAKRVLRQQLNLSEYRGVVDKNVRIVEEQQASPSYPGLQTLYRKRIIPVVLVLEGKQHSSEHLPVPCVRAPLFSGLVRNSMRCSRQLFEILPGPAALRRNSWSGPARLRNGTFITPRASR